MKKEEAKRLVLRKWRSWGDETAKRSALAPLDFYEHLKSEHPDLLCFKCSGDRYQVIAGWVAYAGTTGGYVR
jgi:hypothetical protein